RRVVLCAAAGFGARIGTLAGPTESGAVYLPSWSVAPALGPLPSVGMNVIEDPTGGVWPSIVTVPVTSPVLEPPHPTTNRTAASSPAAPAKLLVRMGVLRGSGQMSFWNTSPPAIEPIAIQVCAAMEFRQNRMLPSHMAAFTPPGWRLRAAYTWGLPRATGIIGSPFCWK